MLLMGIGIKYIADIANSLPDGNPLGFLLVPLFIIAMLTIIVFILLRTPSLETLCSQDQDADTESGEVQEEAPADEDGKDGDTGYPPDHAGRGTPASWLRSPRILIGVWVLLFLIVLGISMLLGGSAVNGRIMAGRFFLAEHGDYTEVSRLTFVLSCMLDALLGIWLPVALYANRRSLKPGNRGFAFLFVIGGSFVGGFILLKALWAVLRALAAP
jgi:hypothetical protein